MAHDTMTEVATYRYQGRCYDAEGELTGVGPWSAVLAAANRLAAESGDELPFQMPERSAWGEDPNDSIEVYPEAWVIAHLADDPRDDAVEIVARSERVGDLLRAAHAEVTGTSGDAPV
jgi:hypothetical protein